VYEFENKASLRRDENLTELTGSSLLTDFEQEKCYESKDIDGCSSV